MLLQDIVSYSIVLCHLIELAFDRLNELLTLAYRLFLSLLFLFAMDRSEVQELVEAFDDLLL